MGSKLKNVLAYASLSILVAGGSAIALAPEPNSIKSKHIVNETIQDQDVGNNALTGKQIKEASLDLGSKVLRETVTLTPEDPQQPLGGFTTPQISFAAQCSTSEVGASANLHASSSEAGDIDFEGFAFRPNGDSGPELQHLPTPTEGVLVTNAVSTSEGTSRTAGRVLWTGASGHALRMDVVLEASWTTGECNMRAIVERFYP